MSILLAAVLFYYIPRTINFDMMMSKTIQYLCEFINTQKNLQISLKYKAIESVLEGTSLELGARFYVQNVYEC